MSHFNQTIDFDRKGCLLFLIDQSAGMSANMPGFPENKGEVASILVSSWLHQLIARSSDGEVVNDLFDVGVLGYHTSESGTPIVKSAFEFSSQSSLVPLTTIVGQTLFYVELSDESAAIAAKGVDYDPTEMPIWIEPVATGRSPQGEAMYAAHAILESWIRRHRGSCPPIVVHICGGASDDGNPLPYSRSIRNLTTNEGNVFLLNIYLGKAPLFFPIDENGLVDDVANVLHQMSSTLPEPLHRELLTNRIAVPPISIDAVEDAVAVDENELEAEIEDDEEEFIDEEFIDEEFIDEEFIEDAIVEEAIVEEAIVEEDAAEIPDAPTLDDSNYLETERLVSELETVELPQRFLPAEGSADSNYPDEVEEVESDDNVVELDDLMAIDELGDELPQVESLEEESIRRELEEASEEFSPTAAALHPPIETTDDSTDPFNDPSSIIADAFAGRAADLDTLSAEELSTESTATGLRSTEDTEPLTLIPASAATKNSSTLWRVTSRLFATVVVFLISVGAGALGTIFWFEQQPQQTADLPQPNLTETAGSGVATNEVAFNQQPDNAGEQPSDTDIVADIDDEVPRQLDTPTQQLVSNTTNVEQPADDNSQQLATAMQNVRDAIGDPARFKDSLQQYLGIDAESSRARDFQRVLNDNMPLVESLVNWNNMLDEWSAMDMRKLKSGDASNIRDQAEPLLKYFAELPEGAKVRDRLRAISAVASRKDGDGKCIADALTTSLQDPATSIPFVLQTLDGRRYYLPSAPSSEDGQFVGDYATDLSFTSKPFSIARDEVDLKACGRLSHPEVGDLLSGLDDENWESTFFRIAYSIYLSDESKKGMDPILKVQWLLSALSIGCAGSDALMQAFEPHLRQLRGVVIPEDTNWVDPNDAAAQEIRLACQKVLETLPDMKAAGISAAGQYKLLESFSASQKLQWAGMFTGDGNGGWTCSVDLDAIGTTGTIVVLEGAADDESLSVSPIGNFASKETHFDEIDPNLVWEGRPVFLLVNANHESQ